MTRLFLKGTSLEISRVEASVLGAVAEQPQRVTALAEREGLTQPAITRLVDRLRARGWVAREPDPDDGRAVLVTLTAEGRCAVDRLRSEYRALLHDEMAMLPDEDVRTLALAIEVLDRLIARVQEREVHSANLG